MNSLYELFSKYSFRLGANDLQIYPFVLSSGSWSRPTAAGSHYGGLAQLSSAVRVRGGAGASLARDGVLVAVLSGNRPGRLEETFLLLLTLAL